MMQSGDLLRLKSWFEDYTRGYLSGEINQDNPLVLKINHTARVCANMRLLACSVDSPDDQVNVAEAIGLMHDLGRFEQYRRYQTFNDRESVNHAVLGVDVLSQTRVLHFLDKRVQRLIERAVRFHNAPRLPPNTAPAPQLFMRMIRDADKLDIWKVFADFYRTNRMPDPSIMQHLPDLPTWSPAVVEAIVQERTARFQDMNTLNDFKLLQLSWIFDLNFKETFVQIDHRGDLKAIATSLPQTPEIERVVGIVMQRLNAMTPSDQR